jgi:hypothetical protein
MAEERVVLVGSLENLPIRFKPGSGTFRSATYISNLDQLQRTRLALYF